MDDDENDEQVDQNDLQELENDDNDREEEQDVMPEPEIANKPKKEEPPPPPRSIPHPIYPKIMELEKEIDHLESVQTVEDAADYICDDIMGLNSNAYRRKIKGFHLAFNIKDKI